MKSPVSIRVTANPITGRSAVTFAIRIFGLRVSKTVPITKPKKETPR